VPGILVLVFGLGGGLLLSWRLRRRRGATPVFPGHLATDIPMATGTHGRIVGLVLGARQLSEPFSGGCEQTAAQLAARLERVLLPEGHPLGDRSAQMTATGLHGELVGNNVSLCLASPRSDDARTSFPRMGNSVRFVGTIESTGEGSRLTGRIGFTQTSIGKVGFILIFLAILETAFLVGAVSELLKGLSPGYIYAALVLAVPPGFIALVGSIRKGVRSGAKQAEALREELERFLAH